MPTYYPRTIQFKELQKIGEWKIKVYTIVKNGEFDHVPFYQNVKEEIPQWLQLKNNFNDSNNKIGFLILHAGTEGIFSLINWWVGKNMLNTHIFLTEYSDLSSFVRVSGDGLAPCAWELDVVNHERISWTTNVLKREEDPQYRSYLEDVYSATL